MRKFDKFEISFATRMTSQFSNTRQNERNKTVAQLKKK